MSRIFLSYSSKNNFEAVALRDWLNENGWEDVVLQYDPHQGAHPAIARGAHCRKTSRAVRL